MHTPFKFLLVMERS